MPFLLFSYAYCWSLDLANETRRQVCDLSLDEEEHWLWKLATSTRKRMAYNIFKILHLAKQFTEITKKFFASRISYGFIGHT
jgi:hypothetical protein